MKNKARIKVIMIVFAFITALLNPILRIHPKIVEKYYYNSINKLTRQALSFVTGILPFQ